MSWLRLSLVILALGGSAAALSAQPPRSDSLLMRSHLEPEAPPALLRVGGGALLGQAVGIGLPLLLVPPCEADAFECSGGAVRLIGAGLGSLLLTPLGAKLASRDRGSYTKAVLASSAGTLFVLALAQQRRDERYLVALPVVHLTFSVAAIRARAR